MKKQSTTKSVKSTIQDDIATYLDYCKNVRDFTRSTITLKAWSLRNFVEVTGVHQTSGITNEAVDCFISELLKRGECSTSVNTVVDVILVFAKWAKEMAPAAPPLKRALVKKVKGAPARARVFYTREEIEEVLDSVEDEQLWLLIAIGFDTGMRVSELANLKTSEIHGARLNFLGKGRKRREVWVSERTCARLHEWLEKIGPREFVWDNGWGWPMTVESIREHMKVAFKEAGHFDFHPHALRHSFATDIQRRGADIMEIKEMMGHSDVSTTQRYLHGFDGKMRGLFAKYRDPKIAQLQG